MISLTHLVFGLSVAYVLDKRLVTVMVFSIAPDVDVLFDFIYPFVHRGITHSLLAAGVLAGLVYVYTEDRISAESAFIGYSSALALDLLTPSGLPLLFPLPHSFSMDLASAYSIEANLAIIAVSTGAMAAKKHPEIFKPFLNRI